MALLSGPFYFVTLSAFFTARRRFFPCLFSFVLPTLVPEQVPQQLPHSQSSDRIDQVRAIRPTGPGRKSVRESVDAEGQGLATFRSRRREE
jgi:hypothetical protein